jgi:hypothetical protein
MDHDPRPKIFAFAAAYYGMWALVAAAVIVAVIVFAPRCEPGTGGIRIGNILMGGC